LEGIEVKHVSGVIAYKLFIICILSIESKTWVRNWRREWDSLEERIISK